MVHLAMSSVLLNWRPLRMVYVGLNIDGSQGADDVQESLQNEVPI
jgi:hypothetical protein